MCQCIEAGRMALAPDRRLCCAVQVTNMINLSGVTPASPGGQVCLVCPAVNSPGGWPGGGGGRAMQDRPRLTGVRWGKLKGLLHDSVKVP